MFRAYEVNSGLVNITGLTAVPILYISTPSTADTWLSIFRPTIEAVSSPSPSSNGSVYFSLNKVTGTKGGGSAVTPAGPLGGQTLASQVTYSSGSTAITGLTQGAEAGWGEAVAFTGGAAWGDDRENTGFSVYVPQSTQLCFYFIAPSGFGSGMAARMKFCTSE